MVTREHQDWVVLEVATSYLHGKYGVEIRIWSMNRDNTHSWVRISHGSNKLVINLNNKEQEIPRSSARRICVGELVLAIPSCGDGHSWLPPAQPL